MQFQNEKFLFITYKLKFLKLNNFKRGIYYLRVTFKRIFAKGVYLQNAQK